MCEHCETFLARLRQPLPTFFRKGICNGNDGSPITLLGSGKPTSDSNKFKLRPFYSFFLNVDEEGAEAVAATVAQFCIKCAVIRPPPPPAIPFVIGHTFFFSILSPQPEPSRLFYLQMPYLWTEGVKLLKYGDNDPIKAHVAKHATAAICNTQSHYRPL